MRRTGHILLLHHSEGERLRWLVDWCGLGLRNGEKVLYVDVAGWGSEMLSDAFGLRGLDLSQALADGRFEFVGTDVVRGPDQGVRDALAAALADGFRAVRLTVREDALAEAVGSAEAKRVEQRMESSCRGAPLSVLCQYDGRTTTKESLTRALDLHPDWVFTSGMSLHRSDHVIEVEGQVDALDEDVVVSSLGRMTRRLPLSTPLVIDLREAELLSVGAGRAVIGATQQFRARGGLVRIRSPVGTGGELLRMAEERGEPNLTVT